MIVTARLEQPCNKSDNINKQGWIQQCFFRGVPGESSGEGARPLGGGGVRGIPP